MKVRVGDVFCFKAGTDEFGTGQLVLKDTASIPLYVVIFEPVYKQSDLPTPAKAAAEKIILVGGTLDSRLYSEDWKILGHAPVDITRIPFPNWKVGDGDIRNHIIENFDRKNSRKATGDDMMLYDYRTTVAPVRFEKAFNAFHFKTGWNEHFEKLLVAYAAKRSVPL